MNGIEAGLCVCVFVFVSVCLCVCLFVCQTEGLGHLRGYAQIGNADALEGQSLPSAWEASLYLCLYFVFLIYHQYEMEHFALS